MLRALSTSRFCGFRSLGRARGVSEKKPERGRGERVHAPVHDAVAMQVRNADAELVHKVLVLTVSAV